MFYDIDISVTLMVSHYIRNHRSASVLTNITHLTLLSKMEILSAQANPREANWRVAISLLAVGSAQVERVPGLLPRFSSVRCLVGATISRSTLTCFPPALSHHHWLCPGSLFKSLRPRRLWGKRGQGPPQATSYQSSQRPSQAEHPSQGQRVEGRGSQHPEILPSAALGQPG